MLALCLFDLDNTLINTDDLEDIRPTCANNADKERLGELIDLIRVDTSRRIYSHALLLTIKHRFPQLKLGVFTRAPRSYTDLLLNWAYPGFPWDVTVAYEDVSPTKPYGNGVLAAMRHVGVHDTSTVALIGDTDVDVKAAYNAGCLAVVDRQAWPRKYLPGHWGAQDLVPDAFIENQADVLSFLGGHCQFLPNMERLLEGGAVGRPWRYDKIGHFLPRQIEDSKAPYFISVAGRSFSNHRSVNLTCPLPAVPT